MADDLVDTLPAAVVWAEVAVAALPDPVIGVPVAVIADVACLIETAPLYSVGPGTACGRGETWSATYLLMKG